MTMENIEELNAHGPYDHSLWGQTLLEQTGPFEPKHTPTAHHNLSIFLVKQISQILQSQYSREQLQEMTLLDIGCYDGWISVQLQNEFEFKSVVAVEPRITNIQKGNFARKFYNISTDVIFVQGEIESLAQVLNNKFDVVLCLNVLHHVDSTPRAIQAISEVCNNILFISSAIIKKSQHSQLRLKRQMNLKDIPYLHYSSRDFATSGYKFESPYFDGSTIKAPIVNLPEKKLIEMSLEAHGFKAQKFAFDQNDLVIRNFTKKHGEFWTLIAANNDGGDLKLKEKYFEDRVRYESTFLFACLNPRIFGPWLDKHDHIGFLPLHQRELPAESSIVLIICYRLVFIASKRPSSLISKVILSLSKLQPNEKIITRNISRSPGDKAKFELAKYYLKNSDLDIAKSLLKQLTRKPGCDWRTFYRSCYFLMVIAEIENDTNSMNDYKYLLNIANPQFPLLIDDGVAWVLNKI